MPLTRGQRLRRLREQRGVEQQEAAAAIGVSASWLSLLERDRKGKTVDHIRGTLSKAAAYYNVLPEYLLADGPQDYIAQFVRQQGNSNPELVTVGRRLKFVLDELWHRWGDEYSAARVADLLGIKTETLRGYKDDRIALNDERFLDRLVSLTGVPAEWYVPRSAAAVDDDPSMRRVFDLAVANGIPASELELLIQGWLIARRGTTKPSDS